MEHIGLQAATTSVLCTKALRARHEQQCNEVEAPSRPNLPGTSELWAQHPQLAPWVAHLSTHAELERCSSWQLLESVAVGSQISANLLPAVNVPRAVIQLVATLQFGGGMMALLGQIDLDLVRWRLGVIRRYAMPKVYGRRAVAMEHCRRT